MGMMGLYVRFSLAYLLLNIIAVTALSFLGLQTNTGVAIGILAGSTMYACNAFAKKNSVYFTKQEKTKAVIGFALINLLFSFIGTFLFLKSS